MLYIVGSHIGWNNALTLPHSPLYRNHTYICCVVYSWQPYWMEQCLNPNPTPVVLYIVGSSPQPFYRNHTYICCVVYSWQPYWMEQCLNSHIGWNYPPPLFIEIIHTSVVLYIVGSHIGWNNALTLPHSPLYRNHTYICCVVYSWQPYWMEQCPLTLPLLCCI